MSLETKLYHYLKLRRRIDRKILFENKWPFKYSLRNSLEVFFCTKNIKSFWLKDRNLYFFLNKEINKFAVKKDMIKPVRGITIESVAQCKLFPWWFDNLKEYHKRLQALGASLIIQGSFADSEITNYSDIDLVLFYQPYLNEVLKIKKEIEVFLLQIDPLQHHGIFMIDINTFDFYWQMDLPVEVLKKAKCFSDEDLTINIKGILIENLGSFHAVKSILLQIQQFLQKDYHKIGLWEWKFFLSQLLLLPTLLLGSKGEYVYKKDSFDKIKNKFSPEAWYSIEKASEFRNSWLNAASFKPYEKLRKSVAEKPLNDSMQAFRFPTISVNKDPRFSNSLIALIKESENLIAND